MNGDIKTENNMITLKELYRSLYNAVEAYLYGLLEINASGIIQYIKDCAAIKTSNADYDSDRRKHVSTMVSNYQKDANYWFGAPLKDCIAMIYDEVYKKTVPQNQANEFQTRYKTNLQNLKKAAADKVLKRIVEEYGSKSVASFTKDITPRAAQIINNLLPYNEKYRLEKTALWNKLVENGNGIKYDGQTSFTAADSKLIGGLLVKYGREGVISLLAAERISMSKKPFCEYDPEKYIRLQAKQFSTNLHTDEAVTFVPYLNTPEAKKLQKEAASVKEHFTSNIKEAEHNETIRKYEAKAEKKRKKEEKRRQEAEARRLLKQQEAERKQIVLNAIPDHDRDLYPLAREMKRHFILHLGPTNSGKTHDSMEALARAETGVYLGPLRLLAYEQYEKLNQAGVPCSLITGEEQQIIPGSTITASTIEMANLKMDYDVAIIDEAQMVTDRERGGAWTNAILGLCAKEIHICASPDAENILIRMIEECGDSYKVVFHKRMTPLVAEDEEFFFPQDVKPGDALIVFSRRSVHAVASVLQERGIKCSVIYGALPYDVRHEQAKLFADGTNQVVVATDAIGLGMNLPIRRVVFLEIEKFDGSSVRGLQVTEVKQIAGRAGRYGIYETGYYNSVINPAKIREKAEAAYPPIGDPVITFPESLLGIDMPLSVLLKKWKEVDAHEGWNKADIVRMQDLLQEVPINAPKQLQYDLITVPFDEETYELKNLWKSIVRVETSGEKLNVEKYIPQLRQDITSYGRGSLDRLELNYKKCDLLYTYLRKFNPLESLMAKVSETKNNISKAIMHVLATQKLPAKTCKECGATLAWNYGYGICNDCYNKRKIRYYDSWYDNYYWY